MKLNQNYLKLGESYLFAGIAAKVRAFKAAHPNEEVISLGIGDVTRPLAPAVICALQAAAHEMAEEETFRGYGPEQGYDFLREAIAEHYSRKGVALGVDEIFVGDGAKSDLGNMVELFAKSRVLLPDPVYPAYRDVNVMAGNRPYFAAGGRRNGFKPAPPEKGEFDIIYICSPNNPTGAVYDREELKAWVDYARATGAVIFFDAAYEAFVSDPALPTSIFEIEGARECAVEFCSFSKSAGFTGMRCGWTVVPRELAGGELNKMWLRRQTTKFNGVREQEERGLLHAKRPRHTRGVGGRRHMAHGRGGFAVHLDALSARDELVGLLRSAARAGGGGRHAGRRVRETGRGLLPPHRFRERPKDRPRRRAARGGHPDPREVNARIR